MQKFQVRTRSGVVTPKNESKMAVRPILKTNFIRSLTLVHG